MKAPTETEFLKRLPRVTSGGVVEDYQFLPIDEERAVELIATL